MAKNKSKRFSMNHSVICEASLTFFEAQMLEIKHRKHMCACTIAHNLGLLF